MSADVLHPKKRNRLTLACTICKKRKVKCDRGKPCSSCIRYNVAKACEYQEPVWLLPKQDEEKEKLTETTQEKRPPLGDFSTIPRPLIPLSQNDNTQSTTLLAPPLRPIYSSPSRNFPALQSFDTNLSYGSPNSVNVSTSNIYSDNHLLSNQPLPVSQTRTDENQSQEPVLQSELNKIKDKIKQIEASVTVANLANSINPHPAVTSTNYLASPDSNGRQPSLAGLYNCAVNNNQIYHTIKTIGLQNPLDVYGFNPVYSSDCSINFFDNYVPVNVRESRVVNHGPLSWMSLSKKDPALFLLWEKVIKYKKERKLFPHDCSSLNNRMDVGNNKFTREEEFRNRMLENEGIADLQPYQDIVNENRIKKPSAAKQRVKNSVLPSLSHHGRVESELEFIKRIEVLLPKQKVIWLLIDRFFLYIYPFMPHIDEQEFRESVSKIIGQRKLNDSKIKSVKVERRYDFAVIGILFIALRFAFISLVTNNQAENEANEKTTNPSEEAQNMKYLLEHPVRSDIINAAQMCLNQFKLLRKSSLVILQCSLYMRLYHVFAPEDGDVDGSDGGQVFTSMLIQMANTIGLNRDPEKFKHLIGGDKAANLWRKIWYQLVALDSGRGGVLGVPIIRPELYDTQLPYYLKNTNENCIDNTIEKRSIELMTRKFEITSRIAHILRMVSNVNSSTKLVQITESLNDLEIFANDHLGSLSLLLTPYNKNEPSDHLLNKASNVRQYIHMRVFSSLIHYHMFLFYEQKNNISLAFYYLKKLLITSLVDILPNIFNLLIYCSDYFGIGFDYLLTPVIEHCIQHFMHIHVALIARLKLLKMTQNNSPSNIDISNKNEFESKIEYMMNVFVELAEKSIHTFMKISSRYYHAWRMSKAKRFMLANLMGDDIFDANQMSQSEVEDLNKTNIFASCDMNKIDELLSIIHFYKSTDSSTGNKSKPFHYGSYIASTGNRTKTNPNISHRKSCSSQSNSINGTTPNSQYSINEAEIDQIWYEMLATSNQAKNADEYPSENGVGGTFSPNFLGQVKFNDSSKGVPFDLDTDNPFDLFGDLSFDHIFN